ncbi:hypothetical protein ACLMJK_001073 [Lecanora helva]
MRLSSQLLGFLGVFALLFSFSIAIPATPRLFGTTGYVNYDWGLFLGGGWRFHFTTPPASFFPVESAAANLDYLYEIAKKTANSIGTSSEFINRYSDITMFQVGQFTLMFSGDFDNNLDLEYKARISWPAIATFCDKMQGFVRRGEVLYYEGVISGIAGTEGAIQVRLKLRGEK